MNAPVKTTCCDKARQAWGDPLPDWVAVLAEACDASSQARVAGKIGKSKSTVSLVLTRQYQAGLDAIERAVRSVLMEATVDCPVVGDIVLDQCHRNQRSNGSSGLERSLFEQACLTCRHRRSN